MAFETSSNPEQDRQVVTLFRDGTQALKEGRAKDALPLLETAVAYFETIEQDKPRMFCIVFIAKAHFMLGNTDRAKELLGQIFLILTPQDQIAYTESRSLHDRLYPPPTAWERLGKDDDFEA